MESGLAAIDRRTPAARALLDWRQELVQDLGGEGAITAAQRALVELVVPTRLYLDHADAFLLERPAADQPAEPPHPARGTAAASGRQPAPAPRALGLEQKAKPPRSIQELVAESVGAQPSRPSAPEPAR
jgi:hypothetical protein